MAIRFASECKGRHVEVVHTKGSISVQTAAGSAFGMEVLDVFDRIDAG
jgi:hypothetical protein